VPLKIRDVIKLLEQHEWLRLERKVIIGSSEVRTFGLRSRRAKEATMFDQARIVQS